MATYRDIFDTRDRLNPKIVDKLRKYGNLEPPGIYGRPYNGGAKHGQEYPLSRANYLRLVAMQDDNHIYKDPRWVWQETARKNHAGQGRFTDKICIKLLFLIWLCLFFLD